MKLWLLKVKYTDASNNQPLSEAWVPPWDKTFGFVIRAETEEEAREIAQANGGGETEDASKWALINGSFQKKPAPEACKDVWLKPEYTSCTELLSDGPAGVVLADTGAS